jgi:diadenylate cyclase
MISNSCQASNFIYYESIPFFPIDLCLNNSLTSMQNPDRFQQFYSVIEGAANLGKTNEVEAILVMLDQVLDWKRIKKITSQIDALVIATTDEEVRESATAADINVVWLERPESTVHNLLTQALITSVADDFIPAGCAVVTVYRWFDNDNIDSISILKLTERLARLSASDLKKLETTVPLETLKTVVDLAVEIGREGREGTPIGTMFVVGDHRNVLRESRPSGFDIIKGYSRRERSLLDPRIHENVKELAQLDGAFVVAADGTIEGCCRIIDTRPVDVTMTRGLGTRHFAAAAISKNTEAIAVVVSQSGGTVRLYQNGEVVLRIEALQRAMKWKNNQSLHLNEDP